jgi:hypothetical protein
MNIYHSTKVAPYVYICIHKITKQFYIGYRAKNVKLNKPSTVDLPEYKTSSKIVNPNFDNYNWYIIAEFAHEDHAYDFEQQLIYENWGDPLLLNKACHFNKTRFRRPDTYIVPWNKGKVVGPQSTAQRQNTSKALKGKKKPLRSYDHCLNISLSNKGKKKPRTFEHQAKLAESRRGTKNKFPHSEQSNAQRSTTVKEQWATGKRNYNDTLLKHGITCIHCSKTMMPKNYERHIKRFI